MSKVVHEKMSGGQWVAALRKDSTLADKCEWEKLSGDDWRRLLKDCPQFADKCDWSKLNGQNWQRLLATQPQFAPHCDWNKLDEKDLDGILRCHPEVADKCDKSGWDMEKWVRVLSICPNNVSLARQCDKWDAIPVDHVCGLLCAHPKLVESCPDAVLLKFRLGHWAKLYCCALPAPYDDRPNGLQGIRRVVVEKMQKLGVVTAVTDNKEKSVMIGGFRWCCTDHWAEEYGSVFLKVPSVASSAAVLRTEGESREQNKSVKYIAENSAMNPQHGADGHGSRFGTDIPKHIQWLAAMAVDFSAMAAEAAVSAPEYAEEYSIIAQAAAYETSVLMPEVQEILSPTSTANGSGCYHSPTGKHEK